MFGRRLNLSGVSHILLETSTPLRLNFFFRRPVSLGRADCGPVPFFRPRC